MKFSELNPEWYAVPPTPRKDGGVTPGVMSQIRFNCPVCRQAVAIYCVKDGPADVAHSIWSWQYVPPLPGHPLDWNTVTLAPSIQMHPVSRKSKPCPAHFSITKGEVTLH